MKILDYTGIGYLIEELQKIYVQKEAGKALSANDFTNLLKQKLDGIEQGAQVNTVNSVNTKTGAVVLKSQDIEFLSTASGASATTIRAIIDTILTKDIAQDTKIDTIEGNITDLGTSKASVSYVDDGLAGKVEKVAGKVLSSNDYTDTEKTKLSGIETGANVNKIEVIKRNGTNLTITSKGVDILVPTKLSDLTNDKTFKTELEIKALIQDLGRLKKEIVATLPPIGTADDNTLYLVRNDSDTGYVEWLAIAGAWESLGDTGTIDLTGYVKETDLIPITNGEINALLYPAP